MASVLVPITAEEVDLLVSRAATLTKTWLLQAGDAIAEYENERSTATVAAVATFLSRPDVPVTSANVLAWDAAIAAIRAAIDAINAVPGNLAALRKAS